MNQLSERQLRTLQALQLLETGLPQIITEEDAKGLVDMGYAAVLPDSSYRITPEGRQKLAEKQ